MKTIHITVSPDMIENGYQPKTTFLDGFLDCRQIWYRCY